MVDKKMEKFVFLLKDSRSWPHLMFDLISLAGSGFTIQKDEH